MALISIRWIIALFCFYACALVFMNRNCMSVAIVAMTSGEDSSDSVQGECSDADDDTVYNLAEQYRFTSSALLNGSSSSRQQKIPEFDWNQELQGVILGASFYLYAVVPPFAGRIADSYGGKWISFVGILSPCLVSALTPLAVRLGGAAALITLQTINGGFMGLLYPAMLTICVRWFPLSERPSANAAMMVGTAVGSSVGNLMAGYLAATSVGWPLVFYVLAAAHLPWLAGWLYFVSNQPEDNRRVSDQELQLILAKRAKTTALKNIKAPWFKILTSVPFVALTLCQMCQGYGNFLLQAKTPTYLARVYGIPVDKIGIFSAGITLALAFSALIASPLSSWIIHRYRHSIRSITVRRIFQSFAFFGPAVCVLTISQLPCNLPANVALLFMATFLYGLFTGGVWPIVSSMAPNFSGTVSGLSLSFTFTMGFVGPMLAGLILNDAYHARQSWNVVFYSYVGVFVFGGLTFMLTTDQQQEWDKIDKITTSSGRVSSQILDNNDSNNINNNQKDWDQKPSANV